MTTIDPTLLLNNQKSPSATKNGSVLGKDEFLKLLMVQLQNQDPTNPMDNTESIAQLATFSSLEQMSNVAEGINKLIDLQNQNSLLAYNDFVGKEVTWHKINTEDTDESGEPVIEEGTGTVASIQFKNNQVTFVLEDGTILEPGNISELNASGSSNSLLAASELIGKSVTYLDKDKQEIAALVQSVLTKDGKTVYQLNDEKATQLTINQIIKIAKA